ncbi:coiled-coil domain-containing protein 177 [Electrophorus electricus]|uniref:coiled-coil domain-containing protein 177 n=1 Tax=Electrophorus electricus TaxID=8005 RepID=UPI0015CF934D|nr:coiled-coil domain-containing protein 177 [Electrophorus electricus]XP_026876370.2 coiled-coil domain-containing protein 177 [Electrophorus electricus]XP_026876371.2 coiled-coil domain-containing protein 177 [Electrophorus electricus]
MVDPLEPEDQSKIRDPQIETPTAASEAPCLPEQGEDREKEEATDGGPEKAPAATPEQSPQGSQPQNSEPEHQKLHLDLYNFDSPAAEGSRYVLTSPHSLEACARCGVKPVELLPRLLSDFAREAPGRSMRVATGMFEVYERDRHTKLRQCRGERERLIQEEKRRLLQTSLNSSSSRSLASKKPENTINVGLSQQTSHSSISTGPDPKMSPTTSGQSKTHTVSTSRPTSKNMPQGSEHLSTPPSCASSSNKASSVSSGHTLKGVSGKQSKLPAAEPAGLTQGSIPAKTVQSTGATVSKKPFSTPAKAANTFPRSTPKPSSFPRMPTSLAPIISKSAAQSPANGITSPFAQHNGHVVPGSRVRERSHSLESLQRRQEMVSSSTASTATTTTTTCASSESASSSYSWEGTRDQWGRSSSPRTRALATFNSLMGRSLSLGDLSHSPQTTQKVERIVKEVKRRGLKAVPERDRKIAALMLARYQEEDIMSQTRYVAHLQWDSERRLEELRREREEREKQRAVLQCHRAWHSQVSTRQRRLSQQEREAAAAKLRQAAESEERRRELAEQQERSRLQKLQQAAREERQKKAMQEQNLRALEEEREAMLEQERLLLREKLTIAELKRQEREHQVQEERRGLNRAEKRRHAALIQEIARREDDEREEVRRAAQEKLSRSQENYEQIQERRGQELREKAKREEQLIQKARKVAEQRERQQKEQTEARAREAVKRAQQAALLAEERAREKAQRAVQSRLEKERLQRLNRQRVEEEEQQRRLELLQSIERKLEKSEQIFREKRAVLESARSVARASFHVRDRVREETNMRTFDKMALEAQLKASLDEK